ncbi:hypothetical protein E2C01_029601 [Portunus trituberculatus]|uniref:Uncharacterized protein n=1 Tax=Portunus trituberculatus TaxID=210409 RepID=A0A5B7ETD1_PORTR|nr:hypothetical protein [Portunus trituberculatus]
MRFRVTCTFAVVLAALSAAGISSARRMGQHAADAQNGTQEAKKGPFAVPQTTNVSVLPSLPTPMNVSTFSPGPNSTNTSKASNTTSGANVPVGLNTSSPTPRSTNASALPVTPVPANRSTRLIASVPGNTSANQGSQNKSVNASALPVTPMPVNTSAGRATPMNASAAPVTPIPVKPSKAMNLSSVGVPKTTNVSSAKGTPKSIPQPAPATSSKEPRVSVISNIPGITNVSKPEKVTPPVNVQQNTNPNEAMGEVLSNLNTLTGLFTVPNIFQYLSDDKAEVHSPLEEFNMCTLTARVGDERGPITVLVAAEDEERMRAPTSFYQQTDKFPGVQRTFTSYCPGRDDVFLTFNPKRRS